MKKILSPSKYFLVLTIVFSHVINVSAQDKPKITIEDLTVKGTFAQKNIEDGKWADEGPVRISISPNEENNSTDITSYNFETEEHETIIDGSTLLAADVNRIIEIEEYFYNSDKSKLLIFTDTAPVWRRNTKGFYYIYDLDDKTLTALSTRDKGYQLFAKFSPDGNYISYVRERDLFLYDIETGKETQLTTNGSAGKIINGTTDWVYEEEFSLRDGFSWSPDSKQIAFYQFDETNPKQYKMINNMPKRPVNVKFKFPMPGEENSEVRIGVINIENKTTKFFETQTWFDESGKYEYIPRMGWTPEIDDEYYVWMLLLNRDQNNLDLVYGNTKSLNLKYILNEKEKTWIDVYNFTSESPKIKFLNNGNHFLWRSENDGFNHLYLYENSGRLVSQITKGDWEVTNTIGVNNGYVYFMASKESPLERHLYKTDLFNKTLGKTIIKITDTKGYHDVDMSGDYEYYIDRYSNKNSPREITLNNISGKELKVLADNKELLSKIEDLDLPKYEMGSIKAEDGTDLYYYMVKPINFDPNKKYPLFMHTYGGPAVQKVTDSWNHLFGLWFMLLAESHDIITVCVDNRGTSGRGKAFASANYQKLGTLEPLDQINAAKHFGKLPYIDENRIGMQGWSYGGYNTVLAMTKYDGPQTIKVGMAVAPGSKWEAYNTIYTERYMSTPQNNPTGYDEGNPLLYAKNLTDKQKLLIIHGDMDDNVHFQNTLHLMSELQKNRKQFDIMIYPGGNHSMRGTGNRYTFNHLLHLMTNYLVDNL